MKKIYKYIFALALIFSLFIPQMAFRDVVSCGPNVYFRATISNVRDGNWSDPGTWGGVLPSVTDKPLITTGTTVTLDKDVTVAGLGISGTFIQNQYTLTSSQNIIVTGKLIRQQSNPALVSIIRFTGINESNFVGGGMDVLDSDIGLWVMGAGQLIEQGAKKTSWTRAVGGIPAGATTILVKEAAGWLAGDEITIVPTAEGDYTGFEDRIIQAVTGTMVVLDKPLTKSHPMVNNRWTAEVMNMTRNVRTEGTAAGRAHEFIRSTAKQTIEYVAYLYMGPRSKGNGGAAVSGRYDQHFHHCENGSNGSLVTGCVARLSGNHCFVPHASDGINYTDNIAYNVLDPAFWWDKGAGDNQSNNIHEQHNIAAKVSYVNGATIFDSDNQSEGPARGSAGFFLGAGDNNTAIDNVAVGIESSDLHLDNTGGFNWEANNETTQWIAKRNIAHNTSTAIRNWQNTNKEHIIDSFVVYNSKLGVFHGAYGNNYKFTDCWFYNSPLEIKAAADNDSRLEFANSKFDGAGLINYGIEFLSSANPNGNRNIRIRNCSFTRYKLAKVRNTGGGELTHSVDIIQSGSDSFSVGPQGAKMFVQPSTGNPFIVPGNGSTPRFAPAVWGNGRGLRLEFFNSTNFTNPTNDYIIDPTINHNEWGGGVWYSVTSGKFSARWTGYIMAQYNETYTFTWESEGVGKLWISNLPIGKNGKAIMEAGKYYPFKFELINTSNKSVDFRWSSPSTPLEYVPYCQFSVTPFVPLALPPPLATFPLPARIKVITLLGNPVTDKIRIGVPAGNWQYVLYDEYGRLLGNNKLTGNSINEIGVGSLSSGVYILKAISDKQKPEPLRIIKQ